MYGIKSAKLLLLKKRSSLKRKLDAFAALYNSTFRRICSRIAIQPLAYNKLLSNFRKYLGTFGIASYYKQLFAQINSSITACCGNNKTAPLPFRKPSTARWLVRRKVMKNIVQNWDKLIEYSTAAESLTATRTNSKYSARFLKEMLLAKTNYLYFSFAMPIVTEFEHSNAFSNKQILTWRTFANLGDFSTN